jgi:hypothetical protein
MRSSSRSSSPPTSARSQSPPRKRSKTPRKYRRTSPRGRRGRSRSRKRRRSRSSSRPRRRSRSKSRTQVFDAQTAEHAQGTESKEEQLRSSHLSATAGDELLGRPTPQPVGGTKRGSQAPTTVVGKADRAGSTAINPHYICVLCQQAPRSFVVLNCGHLCLCPDCAPFYEAGSSFCPLCRKPIASVRRVLLG